jgi:hypothetical protein
LTDEEKALGIEEYGVGKEDVVKPRVKFVKKEEK